MQKGAQRAFVSHGVEARIWNCGVPLSARMNTAHHEGSSHVVLQIADDMRAFVEHNVLSPLFDNMDDACHQLIFMFCLLRLVQSP